VPRERRAVLQADTFFLAGFSPTQRDYLVGLLVAGGARRHHVLTVGVTKVLVGADVERKLLIEVRRHPTSPPVVKVEWLVDLLVPGFLEERRSARREQEREKQRERERAREKEHQQQQLLEEQRRRQQQQDEEKENADNDRGVHQHQGAFFAPDSQSFEQTVLREHELHQQARLASKAGRRGGGMGHDASNSDNSQDADQGPGEAGGRALRRGRSLGVGVGVGVGGQPLPAGAAGQHRRSLGQAGRGLTVSAIAGLKRPSRPVELTDWRQPEADNDTAAGAGEGDAGGGTTRAGKKGRGGLFPPPQIEESQYVTWHE